MALSVGPGGRGPGAAPPSCSLSEAFPKPCPSAQGCSPHQTPESILHYFPTQKSTMRMAQEPDTAQGRVSVWTKPGGAPHWGSGTTFSPERGSREQAMTAWAAPGTGHQDLPAPTRLCPVLRRPGFPHTPRKASGASLGARARAGQALLWTGGGCRRWLKFCIPFASASGGSSAFFSPQAGGGRAESSNLQAWRCFSP